MLRPTAYITIGLSNESATSDVASAVKRSYSYLAPTTITKALTGTLADGADVNTIELDVRLPGHPYIVADGAANDENWNTIMAPWLATKLNTLFGTVYEFNNETRRSFVTKLLFASFTLVLEGLPIRFALEPDSQLRPPAEVLEAVRNWLGEHGGTEGLAEARVPSNAERGEEDWFDVVFADGQVQRVNL